MELNLNYTLFTLGNVQLHLLHTPKGNYFVAAEVAQRLFRESIVVFQKVKTSGHPTQYFYTHYKDQILITSDNNITINVYFLHLIGTSRWTIHKDFVSKSRSHQYNSIPRSKCKRGINHDNQRCHPPSSIYSFSSAARQEARSSRPSTQACIVETRIARGNLRTLLYPYKD